MRPRRSLAHVLLAALAAAPLGCGGGGDGLPRTSAGGQAMTADHTTLAVSTIPLSALDQARALRMALRHASVGGNIWGGIAALGGADATRYAFPSWDGFARGNPGWAAKITDLETFVAANAGAYDVFQMKFCYIDQDSSFTAYRDAMLALEAAYPTKRFIWWTMPLTTSGSDNGLRAAFNQQVRAHCAANGKPLYDIAAIESHDAAGAPVTRDGHEAMLGAWSSDGGHLNADGSDRAARAMWWLLARLAGWSGS